MIGGYLIEAKEKGARFSVESLYQDVCRRDWSGFMKPHGRLSKRERNGRDLSIKTIIDDVLYKVGYRPIGGLIQG